MSGDFVWRDAGRVVAFREDGVRDAAGLLTENGVQQFELLTAEVQLRLAAALAAYDE